MHDVVDSILNSTCGIVEKALAGAKSASVKIWELKG